MPRQLSSTACSVVGLLACALRLGSQTPVILISVDTLRADRLSAYGYRQLQTPHIDAFAKNGTLFEQADAQIPLTLPSHLSLFTSTYPFTNQIEENAERVPDGATTLAALLRTHGYQTAGFVGCVFLEQQIGIGQGFDHYDSPFHFPVLSPLSGSMLAGTAQNQYAVHDRRDGALVVASATRWLAAHRNQPVFAFVHLFDVHTPYRLAGYDAELTYVDRLMGSFQQSLKIQGWWDRSLVIFLADHGESLGEHGEANHGTFIYESTLHVPLILHWPNADSGHPARIAEPVGLIDVAPTILNYLHISAPAPFAGTNLLAASPHAVYAESLHTHDAFGWAALRSLRVGNWKYIGAPTPELYDLRADPGEIHNLARSTPTKAAELQKQLSELLARYAPARPAPAPTDSPQARAQLRSLGYLAPGAHPTSAAEGPDPKDRMAEFHLYEDAQAALYHGRVTQATALLQQLLARDPDNTLARRDLGGCYVERKMWAQARTAFERVLEKVPDDYVAQYELGLACKNLGLLPEAKQHLETACRLAPEAQQCHQALESLRASESITEKK